MHFPPMVRRRMAELSEQEGMAVWEIARVFGAGESGVRRVPQRHRERGTHLPLPRNPGRRLLMTDETAARIRVFAAAHADATRQEVKDAPGLTVSLQAVGRWPRRLGPALKKKSLVAREQGRPDVRAPRGGRAVEKVPDGHWHTATMLSGVRASGPPAGALVSGAADTGVFLAWAEHALTPRLRAGETVVMDNLKPHLNPRVRELAEGAGCRLLFLPPYSPDFNPIEPMWGKVKSSPRSAAARTYDALQRAVTDALHAVAAADCRGFFRSCGYVAT